MAKRMKATNPFLYTRKRCTTTTLGGVLLLLLCSVEEAQSAAVFGRRGRPSEPSSGDGGADSQQLHLLERTKKDSPPAKTKIVWEEIVTNNGNDDDIGDDDDLVFQELVPPKASSARRAIRQRRFFSMSPRPRDFAPTDSTINDKKKRRRQQAPHPLRTDTYQLSVQWRSPLWRKFFGQYYSTTRRGSSRSSSLVQRRQSNLQLEFSPDGYARIVVTAVPQKGVSNDESTNNETQAAIVGNVGDWELSSSVLCCRVPVKLSNNKAVVVPNHNKKNGAAPSPHRSGDAAPVIERLVFAADLHLNPFGARPKLTRGVILRDQRQYLGGVIPIRRVLGTFTGHGAGEDTADLSYQERRRRRR